jgi:hypothetical protein
MTAATARQHFHRFPDAFIRAWSRRSRRRQERPDPLLEAPTCVASRRCITEAGRIASTEHAVFDDTGDGKGRDATAAGDDGAVVGLTYLDAVAVPKAAESEVAALRQQALTEQSMTCGGAAASMSPGGFDREFERLIVDLALVSRVRAGRHDLPLTTPPIRAPPGRRKRRTRPRR